MASRRQILQLTRKVANGATTRICQRHLSPAAQWSSRACTNPRHVAARQELRMLQKRWHTNPSGLAPGRQYDFASVKKIVESPNQEVIILDVREPSEYEAGFIPNALNVPISSQPDAFHLTPEDFFDRFGFTKPPQDKEVVMYCKAGVRSRAAAQLARENGYENVAEYPGSWLDWQKNGGGTSKNPSGSV